jgi:adenylylsulfate kinase
MSPELLDHFRRPRNVGGLPAGDPDVGSADVSDADSGARVRLQLRVDPGGTVTEARFKAFGCSATIACASLATERARGRPAGEVERVAAADLARALALPAERLHAASLAERALREALADLRRRGVRGAQDCYAPRPPGGHGEEMSSKPKSEHIVWAQGHVTREDRRRLLGHGSGTLWLTGLSGSGKSTIAQAVERELVSRRVAAYVLDGDNVRHGLNSNLGFSPEDRKENIRRIGEVAKLFNDAGVIVLTAFISPYREDRDRVRAILPEGEFVEIHVECPLEVCESRDVKGLYRKARAGQIPEFTGISAPYEAPLRPEMVLDTSKQDLDACVRSVLDYIERRGWVES